MHWPPLPKKNDNHLPAINIKNQSNKLNILQMSNDVSEGRFDFMPESSIDSKRGYDFGKLTPRLEVKPQYSSYDHL